MLVAVRLRAAYREGPAIPTPGAMAMVKTRFCHDLPLTNLAQGGAGGGP